MVMAMEERYTPCAKQVLVLAQQQASSNRNRAFAFSTNNGEKWRSC